MGEGMLNAWESASFAGKATFVKLYFNSSNSHSFQVNGGPTIVQIVKQQGKGNLAAFRGCFGLQLYIPGFCCVNTIGHVRYINILTWLRGFRVKIVIF